MDTFYWHDYETWGIDPAQDKPSQFAGVRTDEDFNIIGEPLNLLCRPALDTLPSLDACLVTGLAPQRAAEGVSEREFFAQIHAELSTPRTCAVGYNSIRFDDEVTRYGLYRNFYDPYAREWQHGNSRWDIIDMLRLCHAVRPEGIEWPRGEDGTPSFRLEKLTAANGLAHESAHDALSDVYATIALARQVKQVQPKLYAHVLSLRAKKAVAETLRVGSGQTVLHISSKIPAHLGCGTLLLPVVQHPVNKNEIICVDLRHAPDILFERDAEALAGLLYTPREQRGEDYQAVPVKSVHLNRCPIVLTPRLVDDAVAQRLQLDMEACKRHRQALLAQSGLADTLQQLVSVKQYEGGERDVEQRLYEGFLSNSDKQLCAEIVAASPETLARSVYTFSDERLGELLFRYRARNFPDSLNAEEQQQWLEHCCAKLLGSGERSMDACEDYARQRQQMQNSPKDAGLIEQYLAYLADKRQQLAV